MKVCARCKGKFPGPGIEQEGKLYCCDKCARGTGRMMPKVISAALGIFGLGLLAGSLVKQTGHKKQPIVKEKANKLIK